MISHYIVETSQIPNTLYLYSLLGRWQWSQESAICNHQALQICNFCCNNLRYALVNSCFIECSLQRRTCDWVELRVGVTFAMHQPSRLQGSGGGNRSRSRLCLVSWIVHLLLDTWSAVIGLPVLYGLRYRMLIMLICVALLCRVAICWTTGERWSDKTLSFVILVAYIDLWNVASTPVPPISW